MIRWAIILHKSITLLSPLRLLIFLFQLQVSRADSKSPPAPFFRSQASIPASLVRIGIINLDQGRRPLFRSIRSRSSLFFVVSAADPHVRMPMTFPIPKTQVASGIILIIFLLVGGRIIERSPLTMSKSFYSELEPHAPIPPLRSSTSMNHLTTTQRTLL